MPSVVAYHRPETLAEAMSLLAEPDRRVLAGGTVVVADARTTRPTGVELVDLQALGLDGIEPGSGPDGGTLRLGAMGRVGDLVTDDRVPNLLQRLARRELPSTLRHQATVGGTVALGWIDSVLTAGLLVHSATVELHDERSRPLAELLAGGVGGGLITAVSIETGGWGAYEATGRTPADDPIVAAVARRLADGTTRLALTGVAPTPIEVDPADPTARLEPPGDFRGSAEYRLHLAGVLSARVIAKLDEEAQT